MKYQVETPLIVESVDAVRYALDGLKSGALEPKQAGHFISGARALQNAVSSDIKARIAMPKIIAQEAKLVETEKQRQIA